MAGPAAAPAARVGTRSLAPRYRVMPKVGARLAALAREWMGRSAGCLLSLTACPIGAIMAHATAQTPLPLADSQRPVCCSCGRGPLQGRGHC